ncbi:hypothetical protein [Alcaligenes endophyticus]|uniref:Uncharacterized protein n=1 Tax=Alcaligenes endophyticus TaxID=1929088 RepID=A0ABT8EIL6_9BURK|nr:hypothetical protein [Alcaligenes endophyticus]MCX5592412.1 hypothetical protein [Alcaligenes endophyticus]MDN4121137.1 hypothetical protein [Alcaligenes endophyticus]
MSQRNDPPYWKVLSVFIGLAFIAIFIWQFPSNSAEWAAWVQAFGAVTAVGSGVLLIRHQIVKQKEMDQEKERQQRIRLIKNLKTEIKVNWERVDSGWGKLLRTACEKGNGFEMMVNVKGWPFPVYDACARDLGLIESEETRDLLIAAYVAARGLLLTMEINNELIARWEAAVREAQHVSELNPAIEGAAQRQVDAAAAILHRYGLEVKDKYEHLGKLVVEVLKIEAR